MCCYLGNLPQEEMKEKWVLLPIFAIVGFLLWIFFNTNYNS